MELVMHASADERRPTLGSLETEVGSWEYEDADTQGLTHNVHRYSGKFIPQIAARAIKMLTQEGEVVLDPYCGSGTTLVEAAVLGRRAVGVDLNPLAILIATCKITPVPKDLLCQTRQTFRELVEAFDIGQTPSLFGLPARPRSVLKRAAADERRCDPWFSKWFKPDVLADLIAIDLAIADIVDSRAKAIAQVAFSDILRKSSNAHSGYPNVMFDKDAPTRSRPGKPFLQTLDQICKSVATLDPEDARWKGVLAQQGNATSLYLPDSSVDAVITHPPYIGSVPYAEYGVLSLKWLGADPKALDEQLTGGRRQSPDVVARFREGYGQMFREAHRVLRPGRHLFAMVGNPIVKGKLIDLDAMTTELAVAAGFTPASRATRKGVNRRANKMGDESILFFQRTHRL